MKKMSRISLGLSGLILAVITLAGAAEGAYREARSQGFMMAPAEVREQRFQIRPSVGYAFSNPSEINNVLGNFKGILGVNNDLTIKGGPNFSVAIEYSVIAGLSAGFRADFISVGTDTVNLKLGQLRASMDSTIRALPVYAHLSYTLEVLKDFQVGASAGLGIPLFYDAEFNIYESNLPGIPDSKGTYSASPLTWLTSAFAQYFVDENVGFRIGVDYRALSSNQMKLQQNFLGYQNGAILEGADGKNAEADLSSIIANVGVTIRI